MNLKFVRTVDTVIGLELQSDEIARVTNKDGSFYWVSAVNSSGGSCNCCHSISENDVLRVFIYEDQG